MILQIILLIFGFIILIKGADYFVDGGSGIAGNLKVSKMLIGLTIVAFGTSAPEFAVSVKSLLSGNTDMVLGNVIGSNILNILLNNVNKRIKDFFVQEKAVMNWLLNVIKNSIPFIK